MKLSTYKYVFLLFAVILVFSCTATNNQAVKNSDIEPQLITASLDVVKDDEASKIENSPVKIPDVELSDTSDTPEFDRGNTEEPDVVTSPVNNSDRELSDTSDISEFPQGDQDESGRVTSSDYYDERKTSNEDTSLDAYYDNPGTADPLSPTNEEYDEVKKADSASVSNDEKNSKAEELDEGENAQNFLDAALEVYEESQELWARGNLEKSIDKLDQSYANILEVSSNNNPELIQQKEDLRFMISKRILELYASRYTAVNGSYNAIPLVMNEHVEKEIKSFQGDERKFFMESYKRSGRYRDYIVKSLKEAGLPEELSWLPLIESGFKVRALSRSRALGLWQFIPSTGYKFGLHRDAWVDERLDPEKAVAAAIAYLKELHQIFGDWTTVLAGYNCGEARVLRVIREQKINYLDNFWDLYQRLPRETARYVPRFLAVLHILNDPAKYGFELNELDSPIPSEVVTIQKQVRLKDIAKKTGISFEEITSLNPELRYKITPDSIYYLRVPAGSGQVLLAKLDEIKKWSSPPRTYTYHRVRNGETLSLIARKYRTSVQKIVRANNIPRRNFIKVGKKLKIPLRGGTSSSRIINAVASNAELPSDGNYRVRKGDSLWLIAQKFSTSANVLRKLNSLKSSRLYVGQILKVRSL
jgi:membrane-bound lytic murein transglycosylase D